MLPRRRLTGLLLAFLLLVVQAFWLVHRLEHDWGVDGDEEAACEFCLALHGMGAAASGGNRVAVVVAASDELPRGGFSVRADAEPVQARQQGPPRRS
ncbi:MAG: hypothetical protein LBB76_06705 [Azoarcus sp.]|nr:hypothetical protein [Azoarcus sp.]